jgi:NAD(P)-dependent dehydrogenase (short-subunit alcohol dehydrogenase family)
VNLNWEQSLSREYFREFQGKGVIVAGGASGIGAALVDGLHWLGAKVAILDKGAEAAKDLAGRLAARGAPAPMAIAADLAIEKDRKHAIDEAVRAVGAPVAFISTLGYDARIDFDSLTQEQAEQLMRVNFFAPVFAARDLMPAMRKAGGGAMCLFTSRHGSEIFDPDMTGYGAAKAALDSGIRRLAIKAGEGNSADNIIRMFGFCPGWVQSDNQKARFSPQQFEQAAQEQLVPRGMQPEDIVPAIIFGLSKHSGLLSGTTLRYDGGEGQIKNSAVTSGSRKTAS